MILRKSPEAMYLQIANALRADILHTIYPPGGLIEPHKKLAEKFNVSLITIRKAMDILTREGLLIARKGKGTFVASSPIKDEAGRLTDMSTVIARNNIEATISVKSIQYIQTPKFLPGDVASGLGANCLYIERTHEANGSVVGFANIYIPERYADNFTIVDVSTQTIYSVYETKLGVELGKGAQIIRADEASPKVAEVLNVSKKSPVLVIERKSYSKAGELIEFMIIYYEYTKYSFQVEMELFSGP